MADYVTIFYLQYYHSLYFLVVYTSKMKLPEPNLHKHCDTLCNIVTDNYNDTNNYSINKEY
jgi:hypothetical protein